MKPQNFDRRNFLQIGAASVIALGVTKVAEAKNNEAEDNKLLKTSDSIQDVTDYGALPPAPGRCKRNSTNLLIVAFV